MKLVKRRVLAVIAALIAAGCAMPASESAPAAGGLLAAQAITAPGAVCVGEAQSCAASPCCSGMTCTPNGSLGMLCRRPTPSSRGGGGGR